MVDGSAWAAIVAALLGGLSTLVVAIATLWETIRGNRMVQGLRREVNGVQFDAIARAQRAAYLQGYHDGRTGRKSRADQADQGDGPGHVGPPG